MIKASCCGPKARDAVNQEVHARARTEERKTTKTAGLVSFFTVTQFNELTGSKKALREERSSRETGKSNDPACLFMLTH